MGRIFGHREHLVRVAGLFLAGIVVFVALQTLLIPKGFGLYGHYRAGALDDARARAIAYAGRAACLECHADAADAAKGGGHAGVHCEACHGPLAAHAADPSGARGQATGSRRAVRALPPAERGASRGLPAEGPRASTRATSRAPPATWRTTRRWAERRRATE